MKTRIVFILSLTLLFLPLQYSSAQTITGPDEVETNTPALFTHDQGPGFYYWIAEGAVIINTDYLELEVQWSTDGFYRVQLWEDSQEDILLAEKIVVAGNPPMFEYGYDAAGNRVSREIVYYQSNKKSVRGKPEEETPVLENREGFMVYPNPVKETLHVFIPPGDDPGEEWQVYLFDSMGRLVMHQRSSTGLNEVDMSGVRSGYYILRAVGNGVRKEWRVVRN